MEPEFAKQVVRLHKVVGNADTEGSYIVVGTGTIGVSKDWQLRDVVNTSGRFSLQEFCGILPIPRAGFAASTNTPPK